MTVRTRAQLNSDADTNLADNTTGDIGADDVRASVKNLADSAILAGDTPELAGIELGHATDTTISRGAAGFIAVEGNRVPSPAAQASGDLLYRGSTEWERLAKGTAGQVLTMNAGATAPEWAAGGGWDMTGQTWQSVSRSNNTSYQNTTGKPIQVVDWKRLSGSSDTYVFDVSPNNSTWTTLFSAAGSGSSSTAAVNPSVIIPPGWYYRCSAWSSPRELR